MASTHGLQHRWPRWLPDLVMPQQAEETAVVRGGMNEWNSLPRVMKWIKLLLGTCRGVPAYQAYEVQVHKYKQACGEGQAEDQKTGRHDCALMIRAAVSPYRLHCFIGRRFFYKTCLKLEDPISPVKSWAQSLSKRALNLMRG
eukprot:105530-Pelagomonas_calceolata.AAC.2